MMRRILFNANGFFKIKNRLMSNYRANEGFERMTLLPTSKRPETTIYARAVSIIPPKDKKLPNNMSIGINEINVVYQPSDLDDKFQLKFDLSLLCEEGKHTFLEVFPLTIDTLMTGIECIELKSVEDSRVELRVFIMISKHPDVKTRDENQLCSEEEEFITKRKKIVFENINKNQSLENCLHEKDVPNIAIIGSGGGMRAVIGMSGAMTALESMGILDTTMFTAGVSGSAWYLTTLYANDETLNPKAVSHSIQRNLQFSSVFGLFTLAYNIWRDEKKRNSKVKFRKIFNMTTAFGQFIGGTLLLEKCTSKWSDQRDKLENGNVPLPLIAALHIRSKETLNEYREWIEISPYEVFFPKMSAAIDMKTFGDIYYGGFVIHRHEEMPLWFLQGVCGSGYTVLKKQIHRSGGIMSWSVIKHCTDFLVQIFDKHFVGYTPNFLHGIPEVYPVLDPKDLLNPDRFLLVDAGIDFNSPYPTVLNPSRKVDVILSFDFSGRKTDTDPPFKHLKLAAKWAKDRDIPFPVLVSELEEIEEKCLENRDYEEVYVFTGDNSPTIVHFVMINKSYRNAGNLESRDRHIFDILPNYRTYRFGYSKKEFCRLNSLMNHNVTVNKKSIIDAINSVIDKKQ